MVPEGARAVRFGLALLGSELEPVRGGCAWIRDGAVESVESAGTCPRDASGGRRHVIVPRAALAHAHSADNAFPEYGTGKTLHELVAPPAGEKHRRLQRLTRRELEWAALEYYREAYRRGAGLVADFRELGGIGCETARSAASRVPGLRVLALGRPGPGFPGACDGLGLSSPLDYGMEELRRLAQMFRVRAVHIAETPATRLAGDLEAALRAGFNVLVHGTHLSLSDLEAVRDAGAGLVLCVGSNMWHGMGLPRLREAFALEGLSLGIGTDNASWLPPDPWEEASRVLLAARLQGARGEWAARRVLRALLVEGYRMFGVEPPLFCEGCPVDGLVVAPAPWGVVEAEDPFSALVKRFRPVRAAPL